MERIYELWRDAGLPGTAPAVDPQAVKCRVNAVLDADLGERKVYMKQKLRTALLLAAALAALTGGALAASENWDMLSVFFRGDTAPAQEYVNHTAYSVSDENYAFTVESSVADESVLYVIATVKALNEEARAALFDPWFQQMGTFEFYIPAWDEQRRVAEEQGESVSNVTAYGGFGGRELRIESGDTRKFLLHANLFGRPDTVELWLGQMGREYAMTIPVSPAPTRTLELTASGMGYRNDDASPAPLHIRRVSLSPFTLRMETSSPSTLEVQPRFLFRMADGSIRTQAQMMAFREGWAEKMVREAGYADYVQMYRFYEVQELEELAALIIFGMEYPLDGSEPFPAETADTLEPFFLSDMEPLTEGTGYPVPVRELTEKLGGICHWDPTAGEVTCTFRGVSVVLRPGEDIALVDGEPVSMWGAPAVQNGSLAASWNVFQKAWSLDGFVTYTCGEPVPSPDDPTVLDIPTDYHNWYVIP